MRAISAPVLSHYDAVTWSLPGAWPPAHSLVSTVSHTPTAEAARRATLTLLDAIRSELES